jgi:hypothetical protein
MSKSLPKLSTNNLDIEHKGDSLNSPLTPNGNRYDSKSREKLKLKGVFDKFMGNFNGKIYFKMSSIAYSSFVLFVDFLSNNNNNSNFSSSNSSNYSHSPPMDISTPYNTVHVTHVGFDSSSGEFTGLPKEWQIMLTQSGITRQEQEKNPQVNKLVITCCNMTIDFFFRLSFMPLNFSKALTNKH